MIAVFVSDEHAIEAALQLREAHGGKVAGPELKETRKRVIELAARAGAPRLAALAYAELARAVVPALLERFLREHHGERPRVGSADQPEARDDLPVEGVDVAHDPLQVLGRGRGPVGLVDGEQVLPHAWLLSVSLGVLLPATRTGGAQIDGRSGPDPVGLRRIDRVGRIS